MHALCARSVCARSGFYYSAAVSFKELILCGKKRIGGCRESMNGGLFITICAIKEMENTEGFDIIGVILRLLIQRCDKCR